jgi:hypothetical protein
MTEKEQFIEQELSNLLKEYEYGVIPNSVKVLPARSLKSDAHQSSISSIFQLTLLENIKLIITISEKGYVVRIIICILYWIK